MPSTSSPCRRTKLEVPMMMRVGSGMSLPSVRNSGAKFGITNTVISGGDRDEGHDDQRIADRGFHPVLDLLVLAEVLAQAQERVVERTGRFADPHDAEEQWREDLRMARKRARQVPA